MIVQRCFSYIFIMISTKHAVYIEEADRLYNNWQNAKNRNYEFGLELSDTLGNVQAFMRQYGINLEVIFQYSSNGRYKVGDIIASEGFSLYKEEQNGNKYAINDNVNSHYVYVVDILENDKVIVSSWDDRYVFDDKEALWLSKLVLRIKK